MQIFEKKLKVPSTFLPKAVTGDLVVQDSGEELLIYDLEANRAICLNQTARFVWENCDGIRDINSITENLEKKFGVAADSDLVLFAINQLNDEGLISNGDSIPDGFGELSRREVVKKIGFGSLVALPIVSAIIAPQAVFAQSCVNPGGGAAGTPGNNGTTCVGSVAACNTLCTTDVFFLAGCCNGTGQLVQPGADCNFGSGCFCQCT